MQESMTSPVLSILKNTIKEIKAEKAKERMTKN